MVKGDTKRRKLSKAEREARIRFMWTKDDIEAMTNKDKGRAKPGRRKAM